ncbi:hypothetical protein FPSE_10459 [Fusarium pseudograminearum CS3096]|uniref:Uncharacterized protein n=1 Tax=Fusarium pseudograminearum (strain CS3096) TaxID=1028729 RepID=K3VB14_FUSPC|nr:hypothetical protein FPSE_10459 [Fusarium pseudograminearum CS3096]EKJ69393.1 hypothetical protein FPSE_10459 [Fusarium pseudograminearum CS3096]
MHKGNRDLHNNIILGIRTLSLNTPKPPKSENKTNRLGGPWSKLSNLRLGFPGERLGFIGESDPLAEELRGIVRARILLANNSKNVVQIKAGRFVTSPKALLVPVDNIWHGLLSIEL